MDTIKTDINIGNKKEKSIYNNFKVDQVDFNIKTILNVPNNNIKDALFSSRIYLIRQMADFNNDDLLYRNTIGVDGNRINYTKRVIKDGEVFYYKDDELIKTIHRDGSVTFKNYNNTNIIKTEYGISEASEISYYPCNDGSVYYSHLFSNGVIQLIHEDSSGTISEDLGGIDGSVTAEDGTVIPKVVDYVKDFSNSKVEPNGSLLVVVNNNLKRNILKNGTIIEYSREDDSKEYNYKYIYKNNIIKTADDIRYIDDSVDIDLSFLLEQDFLAKLPSKSNLTYEFSYGSNSEDLTYCFNPDYLQDAKVLINDGVITIEFSNGYSIINDNGFIKVKLSDEFECFFSLNNDKFDNGIYFDNESDGLFYNDINISFLFNDFYINNESLKSIKVQGNEENLEFILSDGSSVLLKNNIVYNKSSDGSINSIMRKTGNVLKEIDNEVLYNMTILGSILSINNNDIENFLKEVEECTLTKKQLEQIEENDIEKLVKYYQYINNYFEDELSFQEKLQYCKILEEEDSKKNNRLLYSTPIVRNGTISTFVTGTIGFEFDNYKYSGNYLEYYNEFGIKVNVPLTIFSCSDDGSIVTNDMNEEKIKKIVNLSGRYYSDIIENSTNYSEKFRDIINKNITSITMIYDDDQFTTKFNNKDCEWAAYSRRDKSIFSKKSEVAIRFKFAEQNYNRLIDTYTHELGHVFAHTTGNQGNSIEYSKNWKKIYNELKENDSERILLSNYAYSSNTECFAECVAEYFASGSDDGYNPNDLKAIEIDVSGYENLYDYMSSILN